MYYVPVELCRLLVHIVRYPWECLTIYDSATMCDDLRKMFDGVGGNLYFDVVSHPILKPDGIVYRAYPVIMSHEPELVLGVIDRVVIKDMELILYFTDRFGDLYSLNSVSFRTTGTEGIRIDTLIGDEYGSYVDE